ncbi:Zn-dependent exopeptidase [Schizophyllum commune Tattone D]|nr:Zn-dependent exopeptidase [Schizophyllum commune Loenen D]KAI5826755.1 Zn-dependent exopeptidase [Schizophyllum commune Tattone D]
MKLSSGLLLSALSALALAAPLAHDEIEKNTADGLRLLSLEDGAEPVWKTEDEKLDLMKAGTQFFDVTETYERKQALSANRVAAVAAKKAFPTPSHQSEVKPILDTVSTENMQGYLTKLTAFNNRYYKSSTGKDASDYIYNTVSDIASGHSGVTVSKFTHSWTQYSIVAHIDGTSDGPLTIIGAHMDSINLRNPTSGRAPGADDDGTGTVNLIEDFRALLEAGFAPATPVEFHWYSGEEAGLLGSQDIATKYAEDGKEIKAFMELDMSGYFAPGSKEVFALEADYIDEDLNDFLKALIDEYAGIPWAMDTPCGYACSDHASWHDAGFPASFPYEAVTGDDDPNVHSADDTVDIEGFSWSHSLEFAKLGVAFLYELAA